jgi:L-lactate utilization protein LutB
MTGTAESLIAQFCAEAEKVGAQVARVQSSDEIKSYLAGILSGDKPATVALSNSKAVHDSGIRQWFISQDIQVISSINEFASIEPDTTARQSAHRPSTNESETSKGDGASLTSSYQRALMAASLGVTSADYAIADTGTLVLVSGNEQHRLISLLPPTHLCLLDSSRVVANLSSLLACVSGEYQFSRTPPLAMTFITGPSRTADIELTLTVGVHGPRQQHILIHSTKG